MSDKKTGFALNPAGINRSGRPKKGETFTEILTAIGDMNVEGKDRKHKEELAVKLWDMALSGNMAAVRYLYDRVDGKPVESVNMNTTTESIVDILTKAHEDVKRENMAVVK